jgi:DNA processing protein
VHLLLEHFSSATEAWIASRDTLENVPGFARYLDAYLEKRPKAEINRELDEIQRRGMNVFTLVDEKYPPSLRAIKTAPPLLYVYGDYQPQDQFALAVVGTRRMSSYGRRAAKMLVQGAVAHGLTIVSGLALGVDTIAHQGALDGGGRTLAVLGSGLGCVYPSENRALAERVAQSGAVISEFPLFLEPTKWTFPRRNRLISGLCRGVLVVEAPQKSGALITAKAATEQGREVFAVPGPIQPTTHSGCHYLIKNGAKLVETVDDILDEFSDIRPPKRSAEVTQPLPDLSDDQTKLIALLNMEPVHINTLTESLGRAVSDISVIIIELEMLGLIEETDSKHYIRTR